MPDLPLIEEMRAARERAMEVAFHTPLIPLNDAPEGADVRLKLEIHQPINSFKIRGVYNAVASLEPARRAKGIVTTSAGNTAQALAWCGRHFGVEARAIMPETAPRTKIYAVRALGGVPDLAPVDDLFAFMRERRWEAEDYAFIHPWTDRSVMLGHSSAGFEIVEDCPDVEAVYIPVGGGGFASGVGSALRRLNPEIQIIGVEPEGCPALSESMRQGRPASVGCKTICDGVAVPYMTDEVFPLLQQVIDEVRLISEDRVRATIWHLARHNKVIAEGAGALAVAAAVSDAGRFTGPVVAIVTGGSIDDDLLIDILRNG